MQAIAILLSTAFAGLAILHIYWALGGKLGTHKAIPLINGKPLFSPGCFGTLTVAVLLVCFAAVALALGFHNAVPAGYQAYMQYVGCAIGAVLILRAIGEFKYAGFFKRIRGSEFAKYDSLIYSPFCLLAGSIYLFLAVNQP